MPQPSENVSSHSVLLCRCALGGVIPAAAWRESLRRWTAQGADVLLVDDLCGLAARRDSALAAFLAGSPRTVAACHPRAVVNLLRFSGFAGDLTGLELQNLRDGGLSEPASIDAASPLDFGPGPGTCTHLSEPDGWVPWFPVIDEGRCTHCRQCRSFCLFGVYAEAEGRVKVEEPRNCKNNCPACARICPEWAIIFPKFGESPIDGDVVDLSKLVGERSLPDLAKLGDEALAAALKERRRMMKRKINQAPFRFDWLAPEAGTDRPKSEESS